AIRLAKRVGLSIRGDFIVGTPGETVESLNRTLEFAIKHNLDYAHFNKFIPYPGTELYRMLVGKGYVFDFTKKCSIIDHSALMYVPESMTKEQLKGFLDSANKRFYLRPGYILRRLVTIRSLDEFKGQLNGFYAIWNL
ncbi:hypothetical protein ACFL2I_03285, partial [Candidatus Omnitrophota bacterium]